MEGLSDFSSLHEEDSSLLPTPWKDASELLSVRSQIFGLDGQVIDEERQRGLNRINAWHVRGAVPLPVENTALLVQAQLSDKPGTNSELTLRMIYATAVIRFVTAICDAFQAFQPRVQLKDGEQEEKLTMQRIGFHLKLPPRLVETRHDATHRTLPPLQRLREATEESLRWLWEYYWKDIHLAVTNPYSLETREALETLKNDLQLTLRTYLSSRRTEVKKKMPESAAAREACHKCLQLCTGTVSGQQMLINLLVNDAMIVPSERELGSSMQGAFLLWDNLLYQLSIYQSRFLQTFLQRVLTVMNAPSAHRIALDPNREAMFLWIEHLLTSDRWKDLVDYESEVTDLKAAAMSECFLNFTHWSAKLAEILLRGADESFLKDWAPLVEAALSSAPIDQPNGSKSPSVKRTQADIGHVAELSSLPQTDQTVTSLPVGWSQWPVSETPVQV